jgi:CheY-like chemotaxis protein
VSDSTVVLLVDDQAFVGAALAGLLADERGIAVHHCEDPRQAIDFANRLRPHVILQDLVMPHVDGLTLLKMFRANPPTASTPIVVLSGADDAAMRSRAMAEGATAYLVKLPTKEAVLAAIRGTGDAPAPAKDASLTLDPAVLAMFRQADSAGSNGFLVHLIDAFLGETDGRLTDLKCGMESGDLEAARSAAHGLAGGAGTVGANKLAALCGQMERHAARRSGASVLSVLAKEIEAEVARVREALHAERAR